MNYVLRGKKPLLLAAKRGFFPLKLPHLPQNPLFILPVASFVAVGTPCGCHSASAGARGPSLSEGEAFLEIFPPDPPTLPQRAFIGTVWRYWGAGAFLLSHVSRKNLFVSLEIGLRFCPCRSVFVREQIKFLERVIFEKGEMRGGGTAPPGPK